MQIKSYFFRFLLLQTLYEFRLEKMAKVAAKADLDFRNNLKRVQSTKFNVEDDKEVCDSIEAIQFLSLSLSLTLHFLTTGQRSTGMGQKGARRS